MAVIMTIHLFSQLILNWYHKNGRKDLPWQKNKTLYIVWISEIMLQQTTVKSVIPYFKKFIIQFPNIQSLSNSTLDEILYLWSGLGYYRRAKNIYETAKIVKEKYQGIFPDQFSSIIQLPGIGKSTAGAILSLTFNAYFPILDGNVKRILVRYYGVIDLVKNTKAEKKLWFMIELITPLYNTGKFNQAMMDIGSLICLRIKPKCKICPLNEKCIARIDQKWENYSLKINKKIKIKKTSWFILINWKNYFWLHKNTKTNVWKHLFCFPYFDTEKIALNWLKDKKIYTNEYKKITSFFHKFSHFTLHIHPILIKLSFKVFKKNNTGIWYNLNKPQHIGLPQPVKKILEVLKRKNIFSNNRNE